jgi:uncharacterized SAM-binding protein YcdF (DUF218 family)
MKLVALAVYPLGLALLFLVVGLVLRRSWRVPVALAFVLLWLAAAPVTANLLARQLETQYLPTPVEDIASADVAIVLGGIMGQPLPPAVDADLGDAVDRVIMAWRLWKANKVSAILVSGGNLPWTEAVAPEGELIARFLVELGVPRSAIVVEGESGNTHENAVKSARLFQTHGWESALLVTSAAHMPRALATFEKAGIDATPVSTDFHVRAVESVLDFLPEAEALATTTSVVKEWVGLAYYRLVGWA